MSFKDWLTRPVNYPGPSNQYHFGTSGRAGEPIHELPAYMGAFNGKDLPDVSEKDREEYVPAFLEQLKSLGQPEVAAKLKELWGGFDQAKKIFPTRQWPFQENK